MKFTFEGNSVHEVVGQMKSLLKLVENAKNISDDVSANDVNTALPATSPGKQPQGPGPDEDYGALFGGDGGVDNSGDNSEGDTSETKPKPKADKAKDAKAKAAEEAKAKAAKVAEEAKAKAAEEAKAKAAKAQKTTKAVDPAEMVKLRQQTIEDLQTAYANGHQKEVFELLSRFGNGAKSFRELPADAFAPIREAIDNGALA